MFTTQNNSYLPQYNLWLPGSHQKAVNQNPPFVTDSIFTWQYVHTPAYFTTDIFFIDSLYGWAAYNAVYAAGVMRTTNSGFNWDSTGLAPGGTCTGVHFIDRNTGWAVGSQSLIRKTTNGGVNWIIQDWPNQFWAIYYSVHFLNKNTGIITGMRYSGQGFIVRTTNGGDNWTQAYLSDTGSTYLYRQY